MSSDPPRKLIIMISSSIYGIEEFLDQIFAVLEGFGYTVWMSHKGTIPVNPVKSNFDNCLEAVEGCDLFLGIITGWYGSGVEENKLSITHQELLKAIELDKPRWFLVHHDVKIARILLDQFRFNEDRSLKPLVYKKTPILSDIRILDMYDTATRGDLPLSQRTGNWVQEYQNKEDALRFINTQFSDLDRLKAFIKPVVD